VLAEVSRVVHGVVLKPFATVRPVRVRGSGLGKEGNTQHIPSIAALGAHTTHNAKRTNVHMKRDKHALAMLTGTSTPSFDEMKGGRNMQIQC